MMRIAALALIFAEAFAGSAAAKDPTDADWMIRMMVCRNAAHSSTKTRTTGSESAVRLRPRWPPPWREA